MNCPNCGKESVEGAKFCESCGAPLVSEVSEPAAPVPPAPASPFNAPEPSMPIGTNTAQSSVPQAPAQMQSGYAPYEPPAQPYGTQNGYAAANANTPAPAAMALPWAGAVLRPARGLGAMAMGLRLRLW